MNTTHLSSLELRLSNERARLASENSESGKQLRLVWIAQIEKEIVKEQEFLGMSNPIECILSDDELLAELLS